MDGEREMEGGRENEGGRGRRREGELKICMKLIIRITLFS
jgi:hypothetical protein